MTTSRLSLAALSAALLLLIACGSDTSTDEAPSDAATPVVEAGSAPAPVGPAPPLAAPTADRVIDVRPLAGQSEAGVQAMLGAPTGCEDVAQGRKCTYARGQTQVVYIDGMADWITISDLGGAPFAPATLSRIGLGEATPEVEEADLIRWDNVGGFREISLFPGQGGRADYLLIKTMTI